MTRNITDGTPFGAIFLSVFIDKRERESANAKRCASKERSKERFRRDLSIATIFVRVSITCPPINSFGYHWPGKSPEGVCCLKYYAVRVRSCMFYVGLIKWGCFSW